MPSLFAPKPLFSIAVAIRVAFLLYGLWQDAHSALKYTDIDYLVFTDAARAVAAGQSPYARETYRYTPLLAWLLAPSTYLAGVLSSSSTPFPAVLSLLAFSTGKVLFSVADLVAGWLLLRILLSRSSSSPSSADRDAAGKLAALWLWNPMVVAVSTRGSSEGLLGALVAGLLCAVLERRVVLAGALLGLGVHFKIYPFVYAPAVLWWMDDEHLGRRRLRWKDQTLVEAVSAFCSPERVTFCVVSLGVFLALNAAMYWIYGMPFVVHTFLHHVSRLDHRHNFSPYNVLLYMNSATSAEGTTTSAAASLRIESVAFVPQVLLSTVLIPLGLAKRDLPACMMAQTFAFVTFNKVCTSQYFLWYLVFLPLYYPRSTFCKNKTLGVFAAAAWLASQAAWLQQGYRLEFLGESTFVPGLWAASLVFFLVNCGILGVMIRDGVRGGGTVGCDGGEK